MKINDSNGSDDNQGWDRDVYKLIVGCSRRIWLKLIEPGPSGIGEIKMNWRPDLCGSHVKRP